MGKNGDWKKAGCASWCNRNIRGCISKHYECCRIDGTGVQVFPKVLQIFVWHMEMASNIRKCVNMVHRHVMKYSEMVGMHVLKRCEGCPKVCEFVYSRWECVWRKIWEYSQISEKYSDSSDLWGQNKCTLIITHQYIFKYLTSSTHVLQHVVKTFAHLQTHITLYPIIFQVYYITMTSLDIFLHKSSHTPNIWYYPCMACRIFATPSEMFGHQFIWFLGIPNALICIPEYFYCARTCMCPFASLHSSPSIQHLSPTSIKI